MGYIYVMSSETPDIRLVVEIKNGMPLELMDLTKSLVALAAQFNSYAAANGDSRENREAKLYVKEIKTGSVILDLVDFATAGAIPFVENVSTIVGFAEHLKKIVNFFLKDEKEKPSLSNSDYTELSAIFNPIAKDKSSQININTTINGNPTFYINVDSRDANALQNIFRKEAENIKLPEADNIYEKVLFYWEQAKRDISAETGNKGIIETLSSKPIRVIFEDERLKEKMLKGEQNPFTLASVVDVKVGTIRGNPALYTILKVHESFSRPD